MNISNYKKTGLFFGLSTLIPWTLWFSAGYISHIESDSTSLQTWVSLIAFLGFLAPVLITLFLARGNKVVLRDISMRIFYYKGIDST